MAQTIVPDSDIARDAGWETQPVDQDIYPQLANYSDTNYAYNLGQAVYTTITFELGLSDPASTPSGSTATVKFRAKRTAGFGVDFIVRLLEGVQNRGQLQGDLTTDFAEYSFGCTNISDYTNLSVYVSSYVDLVPTVTISGIKVEVPDAAGGAEKQHRIFIT